VRGIDIDGQRRLDPFLMTQAEGEHENLRRARRQGFDRTAQGGSQGRRLYYYFLYHAAGSAFDDAGQERDYRIGSKAPPTLW